MIKHISVFCTNTECRDQETIVPIDWMMEIGSACFSNDFMVPCVCMDCAEIDSKNIVEKKFVRCSSCQKKLKILGEFSEDGFDEEDGFFYDTVLKFKGIELVFEIRSIEDVSMRNLIAENGWSYRLPLSGHTCPICKEQTLSFRKDEE